MIEPDVVQRIKTQAPLSQVVGERVRLEKRGNRFVGLCPFHKEKTPSFHVNDDQGFFHCFGCKATGDVIGFIRQTEGLSFVEAVRELGGRLGIEIEENLPSEEKRERDLARKRREELYAVTDAAATFYERCLATHPLKRYAIEELGRRELRLDNEQVRQTLKAFRIGYAPPSWDELTRHLKELGFSHQAAEKVGLLVPRKTTAGHYDRFRHRLMFTIIDLAGRVVGFSGRALEALPPEPGSDEAAASGAASEAPAKYINSPETAIYRKRDVLFGLYQARQAIREKDSCVLVEGNFDVVSLHARGIAHVAAPLGTAFTDEQALLVKRLTAKLVLLFDGDAAGARAVGASREAIEKAGLRAYVAVLPRGTDPDKLVREQGAATLQRILEAQRGLLEYLIEALLQSGVGEVDAAGKVQKIRQVTELIASQQDPTLRAMARSHADTIAARLGIGDAQTLATLERTVARASAEPASAGGAAVRGPAAPLPLPPERARSAPQPGNVEAQVVAGFAACPSLLFDPEVRLLLAGAEGELARAIAILEETVTASTPGEASWLGYELLSKLPEVFRDSTARFLSENDQISERAARQLVVDNLARLDRMADRRSKPAALEGLRRAAESGDTTSELRLLEEHALRAKRKLGL